MDVGDVESQLAEQFAPNLRRVVNATGVILHTNLGRAPLSDVAVKHIVDIAGRIAIWSWIWRLDNAGRVRRLWKNCCVS